MRRPKSRVVVVAENDLKSRKLICRLVEELDCIAFPVSSAPEVLKIIQEGCVELVLLDLDFEMDQMKKADALSEIKQIAPLVPVVIMGHLMTPVFFRRLCDRGAQSFLQKPVDRSRLAITLFRNLL